MLQYSYATFRFNFQIQLSCETFCSNFRLQLLAATSGYNFRLQLPDTISCCNFRIQFPVATSGYNFFCGSDVFYSPLDRGLKTRSNCHKTEVSLTGLLVSITMNYLLIVVQVRMSGAIEGAAKQWLSEPAFQKVFKHTFDVIEVSFINIC